MSDDNEIDYCEIANRAHAEWCQYEAEKEAEETKAKLKDYQFTRAELQSLYRAIKQHDEGMEAILDDGFDDFMKQWEIRNK